MNKFYFLVLLFLISCKTEPDNKYLVYQNIIILSDMSSRLTNLPLKDTNQIFLIVDSFKTECVKPGKKIGDRSSIFFSTFSGRLSASIDIEKIKNLGEKQQFINSTGEYRKSGLDQKIGEFKTSVTNIYKTTRDPGLDLISMLIEKIENDPIVKKESYIPNGIDTTFINYNNTIYIFTDGYLEYLDKGKNAQFYFGENEIEKIRSYCIANNVDIQAALEANKALCLPPYKSEMNKIINLHILETHERDKYLRLMSYDNKAGQRDNEILEAVWKKWAFDSGFKNCEWDKY